MPGTFANRKMEGCAVWREYKDIVAAGKYMQSLPNVDAKKESSCGEDSYGG